MCVGDIKNGDLHCFPYTMKNEGCVKKNEHLHQHDDHKGMSSTPRRRQGHESFF